LIEDIDAGRPASALDQLQRLTKKAPRIVANPTFQALKCLCHQRLGEEDQAVEAFETLLKDDQERKPKSGSGSKGKAAARGKGGRQALLKKIQKVQNSDPADAAETDDKPAEASKEAPEVVPPRVFDDGVINVLQFALRGLGKRGSCSTSTFQVPDHDTDAMAVYRPRIAQDLPRCLECRRPEGLGEGSAGFLVQSSVARLEWYAGGKSVYQTVSFALMTDARLCPNQTALLLLRHSQDPKMAHWAGMSLYLQVGNVCDSLLNAVSTDI